MFNRRIILALCPFSALFVLAGLAMNEAHGQGDQALPANGLLDCFRGVTTTASSPEGIAALQQIHAGFTFGSGSQALRDAGIFSVHLYGLGWSCPNPDWSIKQPDGSPAGNYACWNSPFRKYAVDKLGKYVQAHAVDGILLDAVWWGIMGGETATGVATAWCCCDHCKQKYQDRFGEEMPTTFDWNSMEPELIKRAIEWRRDSLKEVYTEIIDKVKSIRPNTAVNVHGGPTWYVDAGNLFANLECQRLSDFAYMENYHNDIFFAAWLRGITKKPTMLHSPYLKDAFHAHDPIAGYSDDDMNAVISGLLAHGCRPVTYMRWDPDNEQSKNYTTLMEPLYRAIQQKEPYLKDASPIRYAAIVYSEPTKTYYRRNDPQRSCLPHLEGAFETLQWLRVPVEFLSDLDLERDQLRQFKLVVLPNTAILTEAQVQAISQYVQEGGSVLATFETSLYDELGRKKNEFALSDVLGVKYVRRRNSHWLQESPDGVGTYLAPQGDFLAHLQQLLAPRHHASLHMPGPAIITQSTSGETKATLTLVPPSSAGGRIDARATPTEIPAVHINRFGRGQAAYISTPLFKLIKIPGYVDRDTFPAKIRPQWPHARKEGWVVDLTRELMNVLAPDPPIRVTGPQHLESTFFEQAHADRVVVHLLNSTVRRLGKAYAIGPAKIRVRKDFLNPRRVARVWPEQQELDIDDDGQFLEIDVPETRIHQIVVLER